MQQLVDDSLSDAANPAPPLLALHLLGAVEITYRNQPLTALKSQKGLALLFYLACTRRPHSREGLAALFWDSTSTAQSLSNLRTVLARLRRFLGDYLLVTPETIAMAPDVSIWLDVRILEEQITGKPDRLVPETAMQVEQALALYRGDFLAGFHLDDAPGFEDWALVERERLRFIVCQAMQRLVHYCLHTGNHATGLQVVARLLALDPLDEHAHAQKMRLLAAGGQRAAALAHYAVCRQIFLDELGIEPDEALQTLYVQISDSTLAAPPAPAAAQAPVVAARHNLPEIPNAFIGREQTLVAIQAQLRDSAVRLVTLAGEGGVGKSRLALAAAHQMVGAWLDGVWFVPLVGVAADPASTLPDRLAAAVAEALHFAFTGDGGRADPVGQLHAYLQNKELLLILDNFEHLAAGTPFVTALLQRAPRCRMLVTSRGPLHSQAESVLSVKGLPVPPAMLQTPAALADFASVQLFVERAQRTEPGFALTAENVHDVAHLCRLVAGSPLALELAAPWVEHFGLAEMVDILEQGGFELLASAAPEAPARHQSLRTVFVTSWNLLKPSTQRTLAQISVFRGGFQRQALFAVTDAVLPDLMALISQSLLWRKAQGRYEMHDLLRQFASAQLDAIERSVAGEQPAATLRHSRYYLELLGVVVGNGEQAGAALAAVRDDIDNIRHAWRWAIAHHDLVGLTVGWHGMSAFYLHKMLFQEAEEAFRSGVEMLLTLPGASPTHGQLLATLQVAQAVFLNMLTRYDEAIGLAEAATAFAEEVADDAIRARGYLQWGTALYRRGHYEPALARFHAALAAAGRAHLRQAEADILRLTGITQLEKSEFAAARGYLEAALAIYRRVGNRLGEGNALNDLGWLGQREQNYVDALAYLKAGYRVHQAIGNRHGMSMVLVNMGLVHEALGEYDRAYDCYMEVQRNLVDLDDRYHRSLLNGSLGVLFARVGDYQAAHNCFLRALEIDHEIGDRAGMAWTQNALGLLYNHLGDFRTALAYHKEALRSSKEHGARTVQVISLLGIGQDLYELGSLADARDAYAAALALQERLGRSVRAVEAKSGLARTLLALQQSQAALALIEDVLDYLAVNTLQGARQPLLVYWDCYRVLLGNGDPRAASLLREAYLFLQQQADKLEDGAWRHSLLANVQTHQMIVQAYHSLNPTGLSGVSLAVTSGSNP